MRYDDSTLTPFMSAKNQSMKSTDKPDIEQYGKKISPKPAAYSCFMVDAVLRLLLFTSTLTAIALLVPGIQTARGPFHVPVAGMYNCSPAFISLLVVLSVAGLYSIITMLASISVVLKPEYSAKLLLHFALWDVLILVLVDPAIGMAGGVAYAALKGNGHLQWKRFCSVFDNFGGHVGASLAVSLFASVMLVSLVSLDIISLQMRNPK